MVPKIAVCPQSSSSRTGCLSTDPFFESPRNGSGCLSTVLQEWLSVQGRGPAAASSTRSFFSNILQEWLSVVHRCGEVTNIKDQEWSCHQIAFIPFFPIPQEWMSVHGSVRGVGAPRTDPWTDSLQPWGQNSFSRAVVFAGMFHAKHAMPCRHGMGMA